MLRLAGTMRVDLPDVAPLAVEVLAASASLRNPLRAWAGVSARGSARHQIATSTRSLTMLSRLVSSVPTQCRATHAGRDPGRARCPPSTLAPVWSSGMPWHRMPDTRNLIACNHVQAYMGRLDRATLRRSPSRGAGGVSASQLVQKPFTQARSCCEQSMHAAPDWPQAWSESPAWQAPLMQQPSAQVCALQSIPPHACEMHD
jgi:hypothetical protein